LLEASSSDTVRSRIYSGQTRAAAADTVDGRAWTTPGAAEPLPMPLQNILAGEAHQRLMRSGNPAVVAMPVRSSAG
jgi:hypothetical protein